MDCAFDSTENFLVIMMERYLTHRTWDCLVAHLHCLFNSAR